MQVAEINTDSFLEPDLPLSLDYNEVQLWFALLHSNPLLHEKGYEADEEEETRDTEKRPRDDEWPSKPPPIAPPSPPPTPPPQPEDDDDDEAYDEEQQREKVRKRRLRSLFYRAAAVLQPLRKAGKEGLCMQQLLNYTPHTLACCKRGHPCGKKQKAQDCRHRRMQTIMHTLRVVGLVRVVCASNGCTRKPFYVWQGLDGVTTAYDAKTGTFHSPPLVRNKCGTLRKEPTQVTHAVDMARKGMEQQKAGKAPFSINSRHNLAWRLAEKKVDSTAHQIATRDHYTIAAIFCVVGYWEQVDYVTPDKQVRRGISQEGDHKYARYRVKGITGVEELVARLRMQPETLGPAYTVKSDPLRCEECGRSSRRGSNRP